MKLTKMEIVEYIVAFVAMVGLLANIHATAEAHQAVGTGQASPMMIEAGRAIRVDVRHSAVRFHEVALAAARV